MTPQLISRARSLLIASLAALPVIAALAASVHAAVTTEAQAKQIGTDALCTGSR